MKITEYAPKIFRNLRKNVIKEEELMESFIPNLNMTGMFNFKAGTGKSPSFFFFSDNNLLMLKTLKESEKDIIFKKEFLHKYFLYIHQNPDTLLMKIYGIY